MIYIFTTDKDKSRFLLEEAAKLLKVPCEILYFEHLFYHNGNLSYGNKKIIVESDDNILIRWPWDAEDISKDYNVLLQMILADYKDNIHLDYHCLARYSPFYEDKLFQNKIFNDLNISTPRTWWGNDKDSLLGQISLPIIAKQRVSSRSRGNFLINSENEFSERIKNNIGEYIFQEVFPIEHDLRILQLKDKIIGVGKRNTFLREGNRLAVKGMESFDLKNQKIIDDCLKIQQKLQADFIGFDVLIDSNDNYVVIEANISPQFNRFEDVTGIPVSRRVVEHLLENPSV